ncbi:MAG TPA: Shedu anti-phage system protein SduA domain-containing protein, partial [Pyrinomonadaceae bacterium]|nr:Shedu anti-phage system protein SduA domain-containing protein [Pyrinomonadaceae bacterium]
HKVSLALNQLREYRDFFEDKENRKIFHKKYGVNAYRPKIVVIIGRSQDFYNEIERKRIADEYSHLEVITYDEILNRARASGIVLK